MSVDRLKDLCTRPFDERRHIDVEIAVSWLRSHCESFRDIDRGVWREIVKNCGYHRALSDEVIVKQGDVGTCMYIMLTGRASVYIDNFSVDEHLTPGTQDSVPSGNNKSGRSLDRSVFGRFIIHFEKGRRFGEMSLMKEKGIRNASIICDQTSDFLIINKQLFQQHLKGLEKRVYQSKMDFINRSPLFGDWPPQVKRLLEISLRKEKYSFDNIVRKQGDRATDVLFITRGQVRLESEATTHSRQFPSLFKHTEREMPVSRDGVTLGYLQHQVRLRRLEGYPAAEKRYIRKTTHVCSVQENAIIGDVEAVLGLGHFVHTAVCETNTELYVLDSKQFDRFISRKNLKTSDKLKIMVWTKLLQRQDSTNLPIMHHLMDKMKTVMPRKYVAKFDLVRNEAVIVSNQRGHLVKGFKNRIRAKSANPSVLAKPQTPIVRRNMPLSIRELTGLTLHTYSQMKTFQRSLSHPEIGQHLSDDSGQTRPQSRFSIDEDLVSENNVKFPGHISLTKTVQINAKRPHTSYNSDTRNDEQSSDENRSLQTDWKRPSTSTRLNNSVPTDHSETRAIFTNDSTSKLDVKVNTNFDLSQANQNSPHRSPKTSCVEPSKITYLDDLETILDKFRSKLDEFQSQKVLVRHSSTHSEWETSTSQHKGDLPNISSSQNDSLENRVKSFCSRHGTTKGATFSNQSLKLRSVQLEDLPRTPLLGGRVLVTTKTCGELSASPSSQHKHIRRFLLSNSPRVCSMEQI